VQQIRIPPSLFDQSVSDDVVDDPTDDSQDLISYRLSNDTYITPVSLSGRPGFWIGVGDNDDYQNPIKAIEIYKPKRWPEGQFSLKIVFSERTWMVSCPNTASTVETLEPCGIEVLTCTGERICLGNSR